MSVSLGFWKQVFRKPPQMEGARGASEPVDDKDEENATENNLKEGLPNLTNELALPVRDRARRFCGYCGFRLSMDVPGVVRDGEPWKQQASLPEFEASGRRGCGVCRNIYDYISNQCFSILDALPRYTRMSKASGSLSLTGAMLQGRYLNYETFYEAGDEHTEPVDMWGVLDSRQLPFYTIPYPKPAPQRSGNTSSERAFARAREWLRECNENHDTCKIDGSTYHPARIVRVNDDGTFHVVERLTTHESYACLSHRWNSQTKESAATLSNIESLKAGRPLSSLPLVFRHALFTIQKLGMKYIWIDSLCILQDSSHDLQYALSEMSEIFKHASLTISATSSDGSSGLFHTDVDDLRPCKIAESLAGRDIFIRRKSPHTYTTGGLQATIAFPLLTRAWVYQERLLSSRVLHFTRDEIIWECTKAVSCECSSKFAPTSIDTTWHGEPTMSANFIYHGWNRIVEDYSKLELSVCTDRLAALGAIAREYASVYGWSYMAGLWWETIRSDLFWTASNPSIGRPEPQSGPTWSWASISGEVRCFGSIRAEPLIFEIDYLDYEQLLTGTDPFCGLQWAKVTVSGWTVAARLQHGVGLVPENKTHNSWGYLRLFEDYNFRIPGPGFLNNDTEIICLLRSNEHKTDFLALRCIDTEHGYYERIGCGVGGEIQQMARSKMEITLV